MLKEADLKEIRKIIHIDMDCFFAAVEMRDDKSLSNCPLAVGGDPSKRGVICAANYEARKYGIHSAMASSRAIKLYPELVILHPDMKKYSNESKKIRSVFHCFTDLVESLSLDEAYLDVSFCKQFKGSATLVASEIRRLIYEETGLTASAGIAPNKFLAKVASDWNKPNGQFVITPDMVGDFVIKLQVKKISGVGKVTSGKMAKLGLLTCGDLQKLSLNDLNSHFGSFGNYLYKVCRGVDERPVVTSRERKSVSIEETFSRDLENYEKCKEQLPLLFKRFIKRLDGKNKNVSEVKTIFVKIKFSDFKTTTVERSFPELNEKNFLILLKDGCERHDLPVRLIGLGIRFKSEIKKVNSKQMELVFDYTHSG